MKETATLITTTKIFNFINTKLSSNFAVNKEHNKFKTIENF